MTTWIRSYLALKENCERLLDFRGIVDLSMGGMDEHSVTQNGKQLISQGDTTELIIRIINIL